MDAAGNKNIKLKPQSMKNMAEESLVIDEQAVAESLLKINVAAYNSGSVQQIADMYTDDCLNIMNGKEIWTKKSLIEWLNPMVPVVSNFKAVLGPTTVSQGIVHMQKYWTLDFNTGIGNNPARGLSTLIWIKQPGGEWKIVLEKTDYSIKSE
jgi:ketosteroid isomerase-like protein